MTPTEQLAQNQKIEQPIISNEWITLSVQKNGVNVQRKFGGLHTMIDKFNRVEFLRVYYWYRELYPNGEPIKEVRKMYSIQDLPYTEVKEMVDSEEKIFAMAEMKVLTGFIQLVGVKNIIEPARETLENPSTLPIDAVEGYALHENTRAKTVVIKTVE